jgi:hypothetical protein
MGRLRSNPKKALRKKSRYSIGNLLDSWARERVLKELEASSSTLSEQLDDVS